MDIFKIFLRPFNWKVSSLLAAASVGCSASRLYKSLETQNCVKCLNFPFGWHPRLFPEQVKSFQYRHCARDASIDVNLRVHPFTDLRSQIDSFVHTFQLSPICERYLIVSVVG